MATTTTPNQTSVVTIAELCNELRISRTTAWRLLDSGQLASVKIGKRSVRVLSASIAEYLERNRQEATN